jgi:HSP20 family molecular chaperone IbpA
MTAETKTLEKIEEQTPAAVVESKPGRVYTPRADVYETGQAYILEVDLPGVTQESLDISLEKEVLTIKGAREVASYEGYKREYGEYGVGRYERSFSLGEGVEHDKIEAKLENGVLAVTLPKAEEAVARRIEIKSG